MMEIQNLKLERILPHSLQRDRETKYAAQSLNGELNRTAEASRELLLFFALEELEEEKLDHLAWALHVDFYDMEMSRQQKIDMIAQSIAFHRKKGTKKMVEDVVRIFHPDFFITEWFEYGGSPFRFRLNFGQSAPETDGEYERLLNIIFSVKNVRSWIDGALYIRYLEGIFYFGGAVARHNKYELKVVHEGSDSIVDGTSYFGGAVFNKQIITINQEEL